MVIYEAFSNAKRILNIQLNLSGPGHHPLFKPLAFSDQGLRGLQASSTLDNLEHNYDNGNDQENMNDSTQRVTAD